MTSMLARLKRRFRPPVSLERPGVVIVDMQRGFVYDIDAVKRIAMISAQQDVLEACAREDIPVAVLEYRGEEKYTGLY